MLIKQYLSKIAASTSQGDAREESYYGHFSNFLSAYAESTGKTKIQITTLPKKTEAGNPDFRVWDGKQHIVGYIEAKKPGENLDVIENSEQLKRYRSTFPNLILTDFYEYRLFRNGELFDKITIGRVHIAKKIKAIPPVENEEKFNALLEKFFSFSLPKVFTAEQLAVELAKRTRFLRDEVISIELEEEQKGKGRLFGFYDAFKKYLIANLNEKDFADLFSQTITYGLFAARTRSTNGFNRKLAFDYIPATIGILREVFQFISLGNLPKPMEWIIDDIAEVLHVADVKNILHQYYSAGKGEDPIVHFYETFLNIYDPATREKRGVYYTPEPVVRYIVRCVHELLKTHFDLEDGLASKEVTLLDPAAGTLTFPAEAIKLAAKEYTDKYGEGGLQKFMSNQVLKNFYAFELMMAPYAIGHIKISFLLEELGYKMKDDERFKLYLTNTLDMEDLSQTQIPGLESLSEESHEAGKIKKNEPILVIMGNPPYSGHSANKNDWTEKLLKEDVDGATNYYEVDGKPLGEKNPKWLQDDYVKFLRFAQWKIHKAGKGVVGMITNHSYLDNPTFRGMRQSLMNTFTEIYIIDLHGNSLKKETAPDGSKDQNVFDIQQGVSIAVLVKQQNKKGCKVFVNDLYGLRKEKYKWLDEKGFLKKNYEKVIPEKPFYFLKKDIIEEIKDYMHWMPVNQIFQIFNTGVVTKRDDLAISIKKDKLIKRINIFRSKELSDEIIAQTFNLPFFDKDKWDLKKSREEIKKLPDLNEWIRRISYRPFDDRWVFYHESIVARRVYSVMSHMQKENIALTIGRNWGSVGSKVYDLAFCTNNIVDLNLFRRGGTVLFPLYLYRQSEPKKKMTQMMLALEPASAYDSKNRISNIAPVVFEILNNKKITPENVVFYVYAVLYSNVYREKYSELLKIDFPRIPFTNDYKLFMQMAELGKELSDIHLLKSKSLSKIISKYHGSGNNDKIEKMNYLENVKRVYINDEKYFDNISSEIWNYQFGGYQIMERYLKWRKENQMEDPAHYTKMATSINMTIELQKEIDKVFLKLENKIITIKN